MNLRSRLTEAGSQALGAGTQARAALGERLPAVPDMAALRNVLAALPVPQSPATETWTVSIGVLIGRLHALPPLAARALGLLDRFGRVSVGPDGVGIDGEDVPWASVTAVRTVSAGAALSQAAVGRELERVVGLLPPVPGRGLVLARAGAVLSELVALVLPHGAAPEGSVVSAVEFTGRLGRRRSVEAGLAATLVLLAVPGVDRSIRATAEQRGIPVVAVPPPAGTSAISAASFRRLVESRLGPARPTDGARDETDHGKEGAG